MDMYSIEEIEKLDLDSLSQEELKKLYNYVDQQTDNYCYQKGIEYNIQDVNLVSKIDEKLQLLNLIISMAYDAKVNFEDVFSQTLMWDSIIYNYCRNIDMIIPLNKNIKKHNGEGYEGAFVKETITGKYKWVCSFDFNSLYPSVMRLLNVSPETLDMFDPEIDNNERKHILDNIQYIKEHKDKYPDNVTIGANGQCFKKGDAIIPSLLRKMYAERVGYKKKMLEEKKLLEEINAEKHKRNLK